MGETAPVADDRGLRLEAKMLIARETLPAMHATLCRPADTDALADVIPLIAARPRRPADDLVAEDGRIAGDAPIVVEHGKIGMAEPAVFDLDFDFFGPERPEVDLLTNEFLFGRRGDPGVDE